MVESELLRPLLIKDRKASRFSRAIAPAVARRVKVVPGAKTDANGKIFVTFTVEESRGLYEADEEKDRKWTDRFTGCVYPATQEIFVKKGDGFAPGALLLGKRAKAADGVCVGG